MIVNLNLQDKTVVVVGAGKEAQKRVDSLLKQNCKIIVISDSTELQIRRWSENKKITLIKEKVKNMKFISKFKPNIIITTTDDEKINQEIIKEAKRKNILVYSSDNPENSDFSNPAIIDFEKIIQVAVFTGGRSPAMAKKLRNESKKVFKEIISKEDIAQIKIQKISREIVKETITTQKQRKMCIQRIMSDNEIKQLIKDNQIKKAEKRAITIIENWK
ncbi:MAG: Siroheme synthase [Nitrosopumilus sp.]|nr:Siroheme synthase [Nitrosopumilus sp.]